MFATELLEPVFCEAALEEAKRRFGPNGAVSLADDWPRSRCLVGELMGPRFVVRGRGASWSEAFADSEARLSATSRRSATR